MARLQGSPAGSDIVRLRTEFKRRSGQGLLAHCTVYHVSVTPLQHPVTVIRAWYLFNLANSTKQGAFHLISSLEVQVPPCGGGRWSSAPACTRSTGCRRNVRRW
jgi:hypothetical protein